jgi:hypothetical protein
MMRSTWRNEFRSAIRKNGESRVNVSESEKREQKKDGDEVWAVVDGNDRVASSRGVFGGGGTAK